MYFNDYIGNISSTNAIRLEENVNVEFYPRYPICGRWKVDLESDPSSDFIERE